MFELRRLTQGLRPTTLLGGLGRRAIDGVGGLGRFVVFSGQATVAIGRRPFRGHVVIEQLHFFGNRSISIAVLTASFTGMVLALQGHDTLQRFGSESQVGPLVALSLLRELAPVLAGIVATQVLGQEPGVFILVGDYMSALASSVIRFRRRAVARHGRRPRPVGTGSRGSTPMRTP